MLLRLPAVSVYTVPTDAPPAGMVAGTKYRAASSRSG